LDHRRQPSTGFGGRAQVHAPGQSGVCRRDGRQAARTDGRQAPATVAGGCRVGRRVVVVRSAGGSAPASVAPQLGDRRRPSATVVRRGVQVVLEAAVLRDQDVSGGRFRHCCTASAIVAAVVATAAATAAAAGRSGKQRSAVGRSARSKVRFQHHRRQGRLLRRANRYRFQRLSKRSHGHVG